MQVESFKLDHTKVKAPYIRAIPLELEGQGNFAITKYDIRFCQPNERYLTPQVLHTLEHMYATVLRERNYLPVIDFSPMGCCTGFYMSVVGDFPLDRVLDHFYMVSSIILNLLTQMSDISQIPGASLVTCGNYRLFDIRESVFELSQFIDNFEKERFLEFNRDINSYNI